METKNRINLEPVMLDYRTTPELKTMLAFGNLTQEEAEKVKKIVESRKDEDSE